MALEPYGWCPNRSLGTKDAPKMKGQQGFERRVTADEVH